MDKIYVLLRKVINIWYPDKGRDFKRQARLFDRATITWNGSVHEGLITFISERGINVATGNASIFVKWGNVLKIN